MFMRLYEDHTSVMELPLAARKYSSQSVKMRYCGVAATIDVNIK